MNKSSIISKFTLVTGTVWLLSILGFAITMFIATNGFKGVIQNTPFGNSPIFLVAMLGTMGLGSLAYGLGILNLIYRMVKNSGYGNIFVFFIKFILILAFFPLYLLILIFWPKRVIRLLKSLKIKRPKLTFKKAGVYKLVIGASLIVSIFPIWCGSYFVVGATLASQLGYAPENLTIVGTGSMYPTWPKGTKGKTIKELRQEVVGTASFLKYPNGFAIGGNRIFGHQIGRGDIITWENNATRELTSKDGAPPAGLLKRVIGISGDTIELKNGIVYLNGNPLKEPYTAKSHSTFGESFLKECHKVEIPPGQVFAMGDNRKGSADSREIGFVPILDIDYVIPFENQKGALDTNWRDTSKDFDESSKIKLDKQKYLDLLNGKRKEAGVQLLKYQPKLESSASKRGEVILKYNDLSFEATQSGYTMSRAMADVGYYNTIYGEAPQFGYYEADELLENQFEFPESKKFLLNKDYQEVGIAEVKGQLNGCPTQVVVLHFAGYVPPNYKQTDIDSWKKSLSGLKEVQPGWNDLKNNKDFYDRNKADIDRINEIIGIRISNIEAIVKRMEANQWFSNQEKGYIDNDKKLYDEQEALATKLNGK
ncbi:MAG: signal peptidase I [Patescibacteria group bacterium]|nr:signal peptidase I [Patescibacteria group bacterium]